MPCEIVRDAAADRGQTAPLAVHATAVAIAGRGLLILGRSKAGKSTLAWGLIARSTPSRPIALIGDDRIVLGGGPRGLTARPHPRIAGFIERRGLGLVAFDHRPEAPLAGVVRLAGAADPPVHLPTLDLGEDEPDDRDRPGRVLAWWGTFRGAAATGRR